MSETRELTCINCPLGCALTVTIRGQEITVTGNTCPRGEAYGKKEVTDPTRIVTSTVPVEGGDIARLPVKTASDIPKDKIFSVMEEIHAARVKAPVRIGDVVIRNVAGTGADIVAARNVNEIAV
ncbi:MAG: DUF1667 domain-containing protein [Lachnospiraceae bacterium]|nr:DUF1667 domain-containing protein [Lachnospiraceae bacterium]